MGSGDINGDERFNEAIIVFNSLLITNKYACIGLDDTDTEGVYSWIYGSGTILQYDDHWSQRLPSR